MAFFPVLSCLACWVSPEFKPIPVSSRLSTSARPAVKSAVSALPNFLCVTPRSAGDQAYDADWMDRVLSGLASR
jgi:hypothetical protein